MRHRTRVALERRCRVAGRQIGSGLWRHVRLLAVDTRRTALSRIRRVRPGQRVAGRAHAVAAAGAAIRSSPQAVDPLVHTVRRPAQRPGQVFRLELVAVSRTQVGAGRLADSSRAKPVRRLRPRSPGAAPRGHRRGGAASAAVRSDPLPLAVFVLRRPGHVSRKAYPGAVGRRATTGRRKRPRVSRPHASRSHAPRRCRGTPSDAKHQRRNPRHVASGGHRQCDRRLGGRSTAAIASRLSPPDGRNQGKPPLYVQPSACATRSPGRGSMPKRKTDGRSSSRPWPTPCSLAPPMCPSPALPIRP